MTHTGITAHVRVGGQAVVGRRASPVVGCILRGVRGLPVEARHGESSGMLKAELEVGRMDRVFEVSVENGGGEEERKWWRGVVLRNARGVWRRRKLATGEGNIRRIALRRAKIQR